MTPEDQVKEIIRLMNPENPATQTDAVFLVQKYMEKMNAAVSAKQKQVDLLEAKVEAAQKLRSDIENEKLEAETRLKREKADVMKEKGIKQTKPEDKPGPGRGRTL